MPLELIDSLDDPRLDVYRNTRQANLTRYSERFIAEGRLLVKRLLASSFDVESVLVDERHVDSLLSGIPSEVMVLQVPHALVDEILGFHFHRGVLACGRRRPYPSLESLAERWPRRATIAVASGVMDPENLGGIIRSSAAFGIDTLVLGPSCADPFSRRVLRVSMGAVLTLPIVESRDLVADLRMMRERWQVQFAATVLGDDAEALDRATRTDRFGLVFGSEGYGLEQPIVAACALRVTLPMRLGTDSLNVSVATGVFLYHFTHVAETRCAER